MPKLTKEILNETCRLISSQEDINRHILHKDGKACAIGCLLQALYPDFIIPEHGDFRTQGISYFFLESEYKIPPSVFIEIADFNDRLARTTKELASFISTKLELFLEG